ncbi:hypothetical protein Tco_0983177 [Tanacetum coccineum]
MLSEFTRCCMTLKTIHGPSDSYAQTPPATNSSLTITKINVALLSLRAKRDPSYSLLGHCQIILASHQCEFKDDILRRPSHYHSGFCQNIRVIHYTMKMDILLEQIKQAHGNGSTVVNDFSEQEYTLSEYDESNTYVLEIFNTTAGNPVKKILLKLNLSDHRISSISIGSSDVQPSESPYLPVLFIGMSQSRQQDKSESVS